MFKKFDIHKRHILIISIFVLICSSMLFAVTIWQFNFTASVTYPNPARAGGQVKESMTLLILDTDYNFYPANIRVEVFNLLGQKIYEKTEMHQSSPNFQMVVWNVGDDTPTGLYFIKVRAESAVAGNSDWITRKVKINN